MRRTLGALAASLFLAIFSLGCNPGHESLGDNLEDIGDEVEDTVEDLGDDLEDATENLK